MSSKIRITRRKEVKRLTRQYWKAYAEWKSLDSIRGIDAAGRIAREKLNERRGVKPAGLIES